MPKIADAVVYMTDETALKTVSETLKIKGVINVAPVDTPEKAWDLLARLPHGLLVVDWQVGAKEATHVLSRNFDNPETAERPIILIAKEVTKELVATAAEYGVSHIYTDAIDQKTFGARITNLLVINMQTKTLKKVFTDVRRYKKKEQWSRTIDPLKNAITKYPKDWSIKAELADSLIQMDLWQEARQVLRGVEESTPPYIRGIHLLGKSLMKEGDHEGAMKLFETAQAFNPNDPTRLVDIGNVLLEMDQIPEAQEKFESVLAIDPEFTEARLGQGKCMLMENNVNEALQLLRNVANARELASIFNLTAIMNMRQKRHDQGMALYLSAIQALGEDDKIHAKLLFNMGIGYRRWNKADKALQCFRKSLELDPDYTKAQEHAAKLMSDPKPSPAPAPIPASAPSALLDFDADFDDLDDDDLEEGLEYK